MKKNKGAGGMDGMTVDELLPYLKENGEELRQSVLESKYRPAPVRRVEIPKEGESQTAYQQTERAKL